MGDAVIRAENLTFDFGSMRAVDNLTFEVPAGVVFGLLGPNGAGKSTVVRLLLGLLTPTHGRAWVLGHDTRVDGEAIRRATGVLLEQTSLYDRLSAEENLEYHGRIFDMPDNARKLRTRELLTALNLWDRRSEPVSHWSRGMKQQLAVAKALFHRPQLAILDEPTAGLDPKAAAALYASLTEIAARENITTFLTTHKLEDAEQLCSMVGVLRDGKLVAVGPTVDLRARTGMPLLEITGSGFSDNMVALLARRREVGAIRRERGRLWVELTDQNAHTWPLINLLVESGADIEEVHKSWAGLENLLAQPDAEVTNGFFAPAVEVTE